MAEMYSKWVGGQLVFYDGTEPQRWVEAFGPDVCAFKEEFVKTAFSSADNLAAAKTTLTETGGGGDSTVALEAGAAGGVLLITTDNADNDGAVIQWLGEAFQLASGKECYFGCKFKISEATQSDFLVGLAITDAENDPLGGLTDGIYFRKVDAATTLNFVLEKNATETATAYGTAIEADTWYTVEFYFDGTAVAWYVNGTEQTAPATTNLPDDEFLTPTVQFLTGTTSAITMRVDWVRAFQINA